MRIIPHSAVRRRKRKRICANLSPEVISILRDEAEREGCSISEILDRTVRAQIIGLRYRPRSRPILKGRNDAQGHCISQNQVALDFIGWSLEDVKLNWSDAVHPDDRHNVVEIFNEALNKKQDFGMIYRLRHRTGQYWWIANVGIYNANDGSFDGYAMEIGVAIGQNAKLLV